MKKLKRVLKTKAAKSIAVILLIAGAGSAGVTLNPIQAQMFVDAVFSAAEGSK